MNAAEAVACQSLKAAKHKADNANDMLNFAVCGILGVPISFFTFNQKRWVIFYTAIVLFYLFYWRSEAKHAVRAFENIKRQLVADGYSIYETLGDFVVVRHDD